MELAESISEYSVSLIVVATYDGLLYPEKPCANCKSLSIVLTKHTELSLYLHKSTPGMCITGLQSIVTA